MNIISSVILFFTLMIVDPQTHETLSGVQVITQSHQVYYTNFEGQVQIPATDTVIEINYISYPSQRTRISQDSILDLKSY